MKYSIKPLEWEKRIDEFHGVYYVGRASDASFTSYVVSRDGRMWSWAGGCALGPRCKTLKAAKADAQAHWEGKR